MVNFNRGVVNIFVSAPTKILWIRSYTNSIRMPPIETSPCFTGASSPSQTSKGQVFALSDLLQFVECMYMYYILF